MIEHIPSLEPHFIIDDTAPDEVRQRALTVESRLKEHPEDYVALLANIGSVAVDALMGEEKPVEGDKIAILNQFFDDRTDRFVEFDPETEHSLDVNHYYSHLVGVHLRASAAQSQTKKEFARDELRYFRMQHFVTRIIAWKEVQDKKSDANESSHPKVDDGTLTDIAPPTSSPENLRAVI